MRRHSRRGTMLGTVLLVCIVGLLAVLGFCFNNVYNFSHTKRLENKLRAQVQADRTLEYAFARLQEQPAFGKSGASGSTLERETDETGSTVVGRLTFDSQEAERLKIPVSVNNLDGDRSVTSGDVVVPAHCAHLVAVAESGGVRARVDYLLHIPKFPYVIAASGPVQSAGGLLVAATEPLGEGGETFNPAELMPGHLLCNSPLGVSLSGSSVRVTGDIRSVGSVVLSGGAVVEGELREGASAEKISRVNLSSYDPLSREGLVPLEEVYGSRVLRGFGRREGNLLVTGDLEMDNSLLYVTGNLTVRGTVRGKGIVVVLGDCSLQGGASFSGANLCAVLTRGNLTVRGNGQSKDKNFFRGLLYTEGDLKANDVTLVGALVGNGESSGMQLDNVNAVHDPAAVKIQIEYPVLNGATPSVTDAGLSAGGGAEVLGPKLAGFYDAANDRFMATPENLASLQYRLGGRVYTRARFLQRVRQQRTPVPDGFGTWDEALSAMEAQLRDKLSRQVAEFDDLYTRNKTDALKMGKFELDFNQFVNPADRVRLLARLDRG